MLSIEGGTLLGVAFRSRSMGRMFRGVNVALAAPLGFRLVETMGMYHELC